MRGAVRSALLAVGGGLLWATAAVADVYCYQDERGVLFFTNVPTGEGYRRVTLRGMTSSRSRSRNRYDALIAAAARRHRVQPTLIKAVIQAESDFEPRAVSRKGALGLMQLMPETAAQHRVRNVFSPAQNIEGGVRHLRGLLDRYGGDTIRALAAYNAGATAVDAAGGIPEIPETREYVRRVLRYWRQFLTGKAGTSVVASRRE